MQLIPAIDILGGKVVRLSQGRYDAVTVYHHDPLEAVAKFYDSGAKRIHIVDLDGAREGKAINRDLIAKMVQRVPIHVQVGGGIRTLETAHTWCEVGVAGIVLGTLAVKQPGVAKKICETLPGRVIVGIDSQEEKVAVEGWKEASQLTVTDMLERIRSWPIWGILLTDIDRDGMQQGANVDFTARVQSEIAVPVIASGGIGVLQDVLALQKAGVRYAVCGRALYEKAFTYEQAVRALEADRGS